MYWANFNYEVISAPFHPDISTAGGKGVFVIEYLKDDMLDLFVEHNI